MKWRLLLFPFLYVLLAGQVSCESPSPNDVRDKAATDQRMQEMRAQVGLPNIVNFTEAKFANLTAELRDQEIRTWTYYVDMNGGRHLLCESVGYGLPYSVQITNPQKIASSYSQGGFAILPQAEPNGLYMPESADATWVLCSDGKGGVAPVYSEPHLIVSPFPLGHTEAAQNSGFGDVVAIQPLAKPTETKRP